MSRTGCFTWCSSCVITVNTVYIPVIMAPHMLTPWLRTRKRHSWIAYLTALFITELLAQFYRASRAAFYTFAAGNTVCRLNFGYIGRTGHIRCIKQLGCTKRITDIDIAVTDGKNLVLTINISNLMHKTIILSLFKNLQSLFLSYIMAILLRFYNVICHITNRNAPALWIIATALIMSQTGTAAGTWAGSIFAFIFIQPVRNMFQVNRFILHFNSLFHRYYMHTDTRTTFRHKRCNLLKRQTGHMLKKCSHFRI